MNQPHVLVDLNEMSHVISEFLGTEKFKEIVSAIENNSNAGFIAGMCFAQTLAMAKCRTYLYHVDKQQKAEDIENEPCGTDEQI